MTSLFLNNLLKEAEWKKNKSNKHLEKFAYMKFTHFLLSHLLQTGVILGRRRKDSRLIWESDWFDRIKSRKSQQGGSSRGLKNSIRSGPPHRDRAKCIFESVPREYLPTWHEEAPMEEAPHPPAYANPFQCFAIPKVRKYSSYLTSYFSSWDSEHNRSIPPSTEQSVGTKTLSFLFAFPFSETQLLWLYSF